MGLFNSLVGKSPDLYGGGGGGGHDNDSKVLSQSASDDADRSENASSQHEQRGPLLHRHAVASPPSLTLNPSASSQDEYSYQPPLGPPPSHSKYQKETHTAPSGHPSSYVHPPVQNDNPPPYHDWTVIPDTSLLPPPPTLTHEFSANNASWDDAARAHAWCAQNPLFTPSLPSDAVYHAVHDGTVILQRPREFVGNIHQTSRGRWKGKTNSSCRDNVLLSTLPLYFAAVDSPLRTERTKTIYFELRLLDIKNLDSGIAIGYCARPYPSWRLPGWERGSVGVHGDDGRRFMAESFGGSDFVDEFKPGQTVGVGMRFDVPYSSGGDGHAKAEVFFTRNGRREGGWMVDEQRDLERDEGVGGLNGEADLSAGIGVFGGVEFEVCFEAAGWIYRPD